MILSPLQLEGYFVRELSFSINSEVEENISFLTTKGLHSYAIKDPQFGTPELSVVVSTSQHPDAPRRWNCRVEISHEDKTSHPFPYTFRIVLDGRFRVQEEYPEAKVEALAKINAPSLLYSAAREVLAFVTGRSAFPGVLLPAVLFIPQEMNQLSDSNKLVKSRTKPPRKESRKTK